MLKRERGQVVIFVALFIPFFLGVAALSVDVGRVYLFRTQLQNALDAAVLAGAWQLPESPGSATTEAIRLARDNGLEINNTQEIPEITIEGTKTSIRVTREITTVFARVLGIGTVAVTAQAAAISIPYSPSYVFDYVYFLNNWGWFYGRGITANGDIRSNGDFDFRDEPGVAGDVYASGEIRGTWKTPPGQSYETYQGVKKLEMPNLQTLDYYKELAFEKNSFIKIGDTLVIDKVFGDEQGESGNIILEGSPSNPIEIHGPVVIIGDVVIKGTIQGTGTIYAGRNIYITSDINYKHAPSSPRPASDDPEVVDRWVEANKDKDIIGLAARENVIIGDYTKDPYFGYYGNDKWYSNYWLFNMGSEDVGADGIPDTNVWIIDEEHPQGYWTDPTENDGIFQANTEDLDKDGLFDDKYNWTDIQTQVPITNFARLPPNTDEFGDLATNRINKIECVIYTNHACAGRLGNGVHFNGAIVSKDETLIYRNTITLNYDERIHSRYRKNPNWLIDLCLPPGSKTVQLVPYQQFSL
ncbi:MAG: Tad domain-containing protein [bacterium]|nr:Tad domain-containing protein [bacterium]